MKIIFLGFKKTIRLLKFLIGKKNIAQNNILKAKALLDPNISAKNWRKIDNTLYYSQKT